MTLRLNDAQLDVFQELADRGSMDEQRVLAEISRPDSPLHPLLQMLLLEDARRLIAAAYDGLAARAAAKYKRRPVQEKTSGQPDDMHVMETLHLFGPKR